VAAAMKPSALSAVHRDTWLRRLRTSARTLRPFLIFLAAALMLYLAGAYITYYRWKYDYSIELQRLGLPYYVAFLAFFGGYALVSILMLIFRLARRQFDRASPWILILMSMTLRYSWPHIFHDIEYFFMSYAAVGTVLPCASPAPASVSLCYLEGDDPPSRLLVRVPPGTPWSSEVISAVAQATGASVELWCKMRVMSFRKDIYYVDGWCL
jgi:hypothetical protein